MRLGDLPVAEATRRLDAQDIVIRVGRFNYAVAVRISEVQRTFRDLYSDFSIMAHPCNVDFYVSLDPCTPLVQPWQRAAVFSCDGLARFGPFPRREAWPYFEWGLNTCVARWSPYHLMLHAATVAHEGGGLILAGASGSGKSTLAAALIRHGYRLLSDEFALVRLDDGRLDPFVRPVCVKNEMIPRMKSAFPDAVFGPASPGERKGIVAHMKPPGVAVDRMNDAVAPTRILFVKYQVGTDTELRLQGKAEAMKQAVPHCFNYKRLGRQGFDLLADTVDRCDCHTLTFGDAFDAAQLLEREFNHG